MAEEFGEPPLVGITNHPLLKKEFETALICANNEMAPYEVRYPFMDNEYYRHELPLVHRLMPSLGRQSLAKVGDGALILHKDCTHCYT